MAVKRLSTVEKAFRVLTAISELQPIGLTALARHLDLDRAAVQRILATLDGIGWIAPAEPATDGWELTPTALIVGSRCAPGLRTAARPLLEAVASESGETGLLIMVDQGRVVVIDVVESPQPLRVNVGMGFDAPLLDFEPFLAFFGDDELAELGLADGLSISPSATGSTRARGWYVMELEDYEVMVVGAQIRGASGSVIAAIILCGPKSRVGPSEVESLGELVHDASLKLDATVT